MGRVNEHGFVSSLAVSCFKPAGTVLMANPSFHERKGKEEKLTLVHCTFEKENWKISKIEEFHSWHLNLILPHVLNFKTC